MNSLTSFVGKGRNEASRRTSRLSRYRTASAARRWLVMVEWRIQTTPIVRKLVT
jgi:hypothetical protein